MDNHCPSQEELAGILLGGEAQQIYHSIQYEVDRCLGTLQKAEENNEIDNNKSLSLRRQVKEDLQEASGIRFSLNTVDKKIQQEQNTNGSVKQACLKFQGMDRSHQFEALIDFIAASDAVSRNSPFHTMNNLITESLQNRIQMALCYDDILDAHRNALIATLISSAHRLTEIALLLQDGQAIQEVRNMLKSLQLDLTMKTSIPSMTSSPSALKESLQKGILAMVKTHQDIHRLDEQRKEMKKAVKHLNEKMGKGNLDLPSRPSSVKPETTVSSKSLPSQGMVYPNTRRKDR